VVIPIYVESSSHLQTAQQVPGSILDADAHRVLYTDTTTYLRDRSTTTDTQIFSDSLGAQGHGFVTPVGAAFVPIYPAYGEGETPIPAGKSWESGALIDLGRIFVVKGKGSYIIYGGSGWQLRKLSTASTITVSTINSSDADVGSNGVVSFEIGGQIELYKTDGTTTLLTPNSGLLNTGPRTDGTDVLYVRQTLCCTDQIYRLVLNRNEVEQEIVPATSIPLLPDTGYQIAAGWVTYLKPDSSNVLQVWRVDPSGQSTQLTFSVTNCQLDKLGDDGTIIFTNGGRRYLATASSTESIDIGSALGKALFIDGAPYVVIGGSLFSVH
jgi:hypothetical protein